MTLFGFGERLEVDSEHTLPEFGLHVHCPWRIENKAGGVIVTGFADFYRPAPNNDDQTWEPTNGKGSLQKYRLGELLHGSDSTLISNDNTIGELMVTEATVLPLFGLQIDLTPCYRLIIFPDGSVGEQWRLLVQYPTAESTHYVLEDCKVFVQ